MHQDQAHCTPIVHDFLKEKQSNSTNILDPVCRWAQNTAFEFVIKKPDTKLVSGFYFRMF
jgi:hypothetical protein